MDAGKVNAIEFGESIAWNTFPYGFYIFFSSDKEFILHKCRLSRCLSDLVHC